ILKHINEPPPPLRMRVPHLPVSVERIVIKALAKSKDQRYQSAAEMRDALLEAERQLQQAKETLDLKPANLQKRPETVLLKRRRRPILPIALGTAFLIGAILLAGTLSTGSPVGLFLAALATPTPTATDTATPTPTATDTATMIAAAPDYAALIAQVRRLVANGMLDAALEVAQSALAENPQNYDLLALNAWVLVQYRAMRERLEMGKTNAELAIEQDNRRPEAYVPLGFYYHYEPINDRPRAVMFYTMAIERGSQDSAVFLLRALALEDSPENNPKKEADFGRAIELAPEDDLPRTARGDFYYNNERYGDAIRDYEESIRLLPRLWKHYQLAAAYLLNNEPQKALALFESTLGSARIINVRQGEQPDAQYYGQGAYVAWAVKRPDLAARWSAVSESLEPNNGLAAYVQALLARDSGDYKRALEKLEVVRAVPEPWRYASPFLNPRFDRQLDADTGRVLALLGDVDGAIAAFERAKAATDGWAAPYVEQAALYFARGESPKALENLRTALTFPRVQRD
ncbi:MAG: hypothetical protein CUN49_15705, partial [Candidatus Thermofonsia Clade 1 bacterium]